MIDVLQYALMLSWVTLGSHAGWALGNLRPMLFVGQVQLAVAIFSVNGAIGVLRILPHWHSF